MYLAPRKLSWTAGMTGCLTVMGVVAGLPPAVAEIGAQASYTCTTSSGSHRVTAQIKVKVPTRGVVGEPVRLGMAGLTLTVPAALRAEMLKGTGELPEDTAGEALPVRTEVNASARVGVALTQGGRSADADWPLFKVAGEQGRGVGDKPWKLTGTADVPAVMPEVPGRITWSARELALAFAVTTPGGASSPAVVCTADREVALGAAMVQGGASPGPSAPPPPSSGKRSVPSASESASETADCVRVPDHKTDPTWDFNTDPRLWNVFESPSLPDPKAAENWREVPPDPAARRGVPYCVRAAGFASVKKLGASAPMAAQTALRRAVYGIMPNPATGNTANYVQQRGYFKNYARPATANVLSFGFMPTKATTLVDQVAPPGSDNPQLNTGNLRSDVANNAQRPGATRDGAEVPDETRARAFVKTRVRDVSVNGVPIDVGPNCGGAPTVLDLYFFSGNYATGRTLVTQGGTLTGEVDIPKFSGCGVGEDLSPLLNASISGPGNRVQVEAGPWCLTAVATEGCDQKGEPRTWTVKPGGTFKVTKKEPFVLTSGTTGAEVRCESLTMRARVKKGHWNGRFILGEIPEVKFSGCSMKSGPDASPVKTTVTAKGAPWAINIVDIGGPYDDGLVSLLISRVVVNATAADSGNDGKECNVRFAGKASGLDEERTTTFSGSYDNNGTFSLTEGATMQVTPASDCKTLPEGFDPDSYLTHGGSFSFAPSQRFIPSWTGETNP